MKTCKRCKKPTNEFPLTLHGKRSVMCSPCTLFTRNRNRQKLENLKTSMDSPPDGMKVCRRCMKPKPVSEFAPNLSACFRYRKSTSCKECRKYAARKGAEYRAAHPAARRAKEAKEKATAAASLRVEILAAYGGRCVCCGEDEPKFLQLDHVNNDGKAHRKAIGVGVHNLLRWAKENKYPPTLQVLCANCHNAKSFYGGCPHRAFNVLHLVDKTA